MNKTLLILVSLFSLFLYSCKSSNTPEAAASKFILSMRTLDFETAKEMSTKATWNLINIIDAHTKAVTDEQKQALGENFKISITNVEPESDSTVLISYSTDPAFVIVPKIRMIREFDIDGRTRWKADISSIDSMLMGEEDYIEETMVPVLEESDSTNTLNPELTDTTKRN